VCETHVIVLIFALFALLFTLHLIESQKTKIIIDYLYRVYNELVIVKAETKAVARKIEEINEKIATEQFNKP